MSFELRHDGQGAWEFTGDLDLAAIGTLERSLGESSSVHTVDLGAVDFIDSSGLHGLVQIRQRHPQCRYVNVPQRVRRLFELTGLAESVLDA